MTALLAAPIVVPLVGAAACLAAGQRPRLRRAVSLVTALGHLLVATAVLARVADGEVLALAVGRWPAPAGIVLVADVLSAGLLVAASLVAGSALLALRGPYLEDLSARTCYALVLVLVGGVSGAFLTGDLFNLYVWFEVLLISSFVLVVAGGGRRRMEGGTTYVAVNLVASTLFLAAVGLLYGEAGTVNMAHLGRVVASSPVSPTMAAAAALLLVAFGVKAALFPVFSWLPAAYPGLPSPLGALFSGLLTKVGVYALLRVFTQVFPPPFVFVHPTIAVAAGATMLVGVLGALAQGEIRALLSFHIVSQVGYLAMGLALATPLALAGAAYFLVHNILAKSNLFLVAGLLERAGGSTELAELGGLYPARWGLSVLFLLPALSLAGIPPLSGFWAKVVLIAAALDVSAWILVAAALATSLLTLLSMTKIWNEAYWKPAPTPGRGEPLPPTLVAGAVVLAAATLALGLVPGPFLDLAVEAGQQLSDPGIYREAVLPEGALGGGSP